MTFKKWNPIQKDEGVLFVEAVYDDYEGFRVLLKGNDLESRVMRISFDCVLSYRNTDEGDLLKTISEHDFKGWSLYVSINSEYLKWFHQESANTHGGSSVVHYAIYTPNDCLDVLSEYPPKVEWLN